MSREKVIFSTQAKTKEAPLPRCSKRPSLMPDYFVVRTNNLSLLGIKGQSPMPFYSAYYVRTDEEEGLAKSQNR